jgi:hypothetical protein
VARVCARGENEVVIVDLWEAEEDLRSMQENPQFLRNLEAAGWPSDPSSRSTRCMPPSRDWQIG